MIHIIFTTILHLRRTELRKDSVTEKFVESNVGPILLKTKTQFVGWFKPIRFSCSVFLMSSLVVIITMSNSSSDLDLSSVLSKENQVFVTHFYSICSECLKIGLSRQGCSGRVQLDPRTKTSKSATAKATLT